MKAKQQTTIVDNDEALTEPTTSARCPASLMIRLAILWNLMATAGLACYMLTSDVAPSMMETVVRSFSRQKNQLEKRLVLVKDRDLGSFSFRTNDSDLQEGIVQISLGDDGGTNSPSYEPLSKGLSFEFVLEQDATVALELQFRIELLSGPAIDHTSNEPLVCQALASIDDAVLGQAPYDFMGQLVVRGNRSRLDSSWKTFHSFSPLPLDAGSHVLHLGAYCNARTHKARLSFDKVAVEARTTRPSDLLRSAAAMYSRSLVASLAMDTSNPKAHCHLAVDRLSIDTFKNNIRVLSAFGDRTQGSNSYYKAAGWVEQTLIGYGYKVERAPYTYGGKSRDSMYVTKVGTTFPDRMFIVSAHLDGRGGGGAANDDASGCSLLLEMARILAFNDISTKISIRLIFWNNEETGLNGSSGYATKREALQGKENPVGSGIYPEPTWLGIIQHDQILFDHGLPPQADQIANADLNIEYLGTSVFRKQSLALANALFSGNAEYAQYYAASVGDKMAYTDSVPFADLAASVSVRENERIAGIGQGSQPNWHKPTDLFATYSDKDYLFGLNVVQTTLGSVAELAGLRVNLVEMCLRTLRTTCQCSVGGDDCFATTVSSKCYYPINAAENDLFQRRILARYTRRCSIRRFRFGS